MRKILLLGAAAAALSIAAPAQAVIVNYTFSGTGTGTMALDLTAGTYTLNALNLALGTATFTTLNSGLAPFGAPTYILGGTPVSLSTVDNTTNDFALLFNPALASQTVAVDYANGAGSLRGQIGINVAAVPEPSSWAMMLLGFAGIGFVVSRKRKLLQAA